jgi:predicted AAA+ superfamily ATPase
MEMLIERKPYMRQLRELRDEHIIKVITGVRH